LNSSSEIKKKSEETRQQQPKEIMIKKNRESLKNKLMQHLAREAIGREAETRFGKISCSPIQS